MTTSDGDNNETGEDDEELLEILKQFRADGERIANEPVWSDRIKELFSILPKDVLIPLAARIKETGARESVRLEEFAKIHGLTPAEQKMLLGIADGQSVPEYAEAAGISVNTARVHIQKVLEKTGTNRQTDLLRKLCQRQ